MRYTQSWPVCLGSLLITVCGCAHPPLARYVYQDGEYGVVGIPINTYHDRLDVRVQAEELMARHFPEGYEIVRAEEVNEGERILDLGNRTELVAEPVFKALSQVIQLGKVDRTTSFEEKDKLQARECRIIYKKKPAQTPPGGPGRFAAVASLSPPLYIDPNEIVRRQIDPAILARANPSAKKATDRDVRTVSGESIKMTADPSSSAQSAGRSDW
jgi:hypothetical protein